MCARGCIQQRINNCETNIVVLRYCRTLCSFRAYVDGQLVVEGVFTLVMVVNK